MNKHDRMEIVLRQMDIWYQGIPGSLLFEAERAELDTLLPQYFGQHLLQVGGPSEVFLFEKSPISHRVRLSPEYASVFRGPSVQGLFHRMPFLPESIDVVLLPHVLEFVKTPELILQQLHDVMVPEGYLLLLGFNPSSLWGWVKWFTQRKTLPWRGRFRSIAKVRQWLMHQGFEIVEQRTFFFRPPLTNKIGLRKLLFLEAIGRLFCSSFGAVYLLVAKKRVAAMIPLKQQRSQKPAPVDGYLEPSARAHRKAG